MTMTDPAWRFRRGILMLPMLLAGTLVLAEGFTTPEFARGEYRPKRIVLLPPHATAATNKVTSSEPVIEGGSRLEDAAVLELQKRFHALGYELGVLGVAEVNADPELQVLVRSLNERYDEEAARFQVSYREGLRGADVRERRFKLGDGARILADRLDTEALAIARIAAEGASGGRKTLGVLFGGSIGFASVHVGIVAGDNGDLEAYYVGYYAGMSPQRLQEEPVEIMAEVLSRALGEFPSVDEDGRYKERWPETSNRESPAPATSTETVIKDLEALFGDEAPADRTDSTGDIDDGTDP